MKQNQTVLVIDDDESIIEVITIVLSSKGWNIATLSNPDDIESIISLSPKVILMDLWMPGLGGESLTKKLKAHPLTKHIPIIIISAHNNAAAITEKIGADAFLLKPFDIDELENAVYSVKLRQ